MEEKRNRMKVARGQEKSKTGSSMRSHAKPREGQALADPRFKGFQAPGGQEVWTTGLSQSLGSLCPTS